MNYNLDNSTTRTENGLVENLTKKNAQGIAEMRTDALPVMVPIQEKDWDTMVSLLQSAADFQPTVYELMRTLLTVSKMKMMMEQWSVAEQKQLRHQGDGNQTEHSADNGGKYSFADEEPRTTGWESSRKNYERYLGSGQGTGESYRQGTRENRSPHVVDSHGDISGSFSIGGGIINSALCSLAGVTDGSEDPEECRKRIEAEQNASNLGAVIGLAVGLVSAATDTADDSLPKELSEEQNEIKFTM